MPIPSDMLCSPDISTASLSVPTVRDMRRSRGSTVQRFLFFALPSALSFLKEKENYDADIVVQLRPTYPIRNVDDIDRMIQLLIDHPEADSVRTIAPAKEIAYKMWRWQEDGRITPLLTDIPEAYNMPRQQLPVIYYQNACIDVTRGSVVLKKNSMTGDRILGYQMNQNYDIDTEEEFERADKALRAQQIE